MVYNRYELLAGYNSWANTQVYKYAAQLSEADYKADRGAFFKSVHGTLNHILVADRFWLHRFTGQGTFPATLDAILYDTLPELNASRRTEDERIVRFAKTITEELLKSTLRYTPVTNPVPIEQSLAPALDHFFNHQTHHRGQVHALLTGITGIAPSLDLINYYREQMI